MNDLIVFVAASKRMASEIYDFIRFCRNLREELVIGKLDGTIFHNVILPQKVAQLFSACSLCSKLRIIRVNPFSLEIILNIFKICSFYLSLA